MKLLTKILTQKATEQEKEAFYTSIKNDTEKREEALDIQNLWHLAQMKDQKVSSSKKKAIFENFWGLTGAKNKQIWMLNIVRYVAAIMLALISGMSIQYLFFKPTF